jgi:hypothetical protein
VGGPCAEENKASRLGLLLWQADLLALVALSQPFEQERHQLVLDLQGIHFQIFHSLKTVFVFPVGFAKMFVQLNLAHA